MARKLQYKLLGEVTIIGSGYGFEANTSGATLTDGVVGSITIKDPGSGYTVGQDYNVTIVGGTGGAGTDLNATVLGTDIVDGAIVVNLLDGGSGYTSEPTIILKGGKLEEYEYPYSFIEDSRIVLEAEKLLTQTEWFRKFDFMEMANF